MTLQEKQKTSVINFGDSPKIFLFYTLRDLPSTEKVESQARGSSRFWARFKCIMIVPKRFLREMFGHTSTIVISVEYISSYMLIYCTLSLGSKNTMTIYSMTFIYPIRLHPSLFCVILGFSKVIKIIRYPE